MSPDVSASIRARLLNRARSVGIEFQLYLVRYACERLLYRLGQSEVRNKLILKGGTLLALWMPDLSGPPVTSTCLLLTRTVRK